MTTALQRLTDLAAKSPEAFRRNLQAVLDDRDNWKSRAAERDAECERRFRAQHDAEARSEVDSLDAARWRALLSACPDALGSAGLDWNEDGSVSLKVDADGYIHTGICNFYTQASLAYFNETSIARGRAILTAIADQVIKQGGEAWAFVNGKRIKVTKAVET